MFCPRCGESVNDYAKYCERCGHPLTDTIVLKTPNKNNDSKAGVFILLVGLALLIGFVIFYLGDYSSTDFTFEDEHIAYVKSGSPSSYPDVTYDEAFCNFFTNRSWNYFESNDGKDVVEFKGDCTYHDVEVTATMQFVLDMNEGTFEISYLAFNDVPQSLLIEYALITKVFESY